MASHLLLRGRVLDEVTRLPIPSASIRTGDSLHWASATDGSFELRLQDVDSEDLEIIVRAPEYDPLVKAVLAIDAPLADVGTILLAPNAARTIRVVLAGGSPVPSATVLLASTSPYAVALNVFRSKPVATTDAGGTCDVALPTGSVVFAVYGDLASPTALLTRRTDNLTLTLSAASTRVVGLRDAETAAPLAGVELRAIRLASSPVEGYSCRTLDDGTIEHAIPPGRYELGLPDPSLAWRPHGLPVVEIAGTGVLQWIDVDRAPRRDIMIIDRASRQPVEFAHAWLASFEEPPFVEEAQWVSLGQPVSVHDGRLSLHALPALFDGDYPYRLFLAAGGYEDSYLDDPLSVVPPQSHRTIALDPGRQRRIRVAASDGSPFLDSVIAVSEYPMAKPHHESLPNAEGLVGPFWWRGHGLEVSMAGQSLGTVASDRLLGDEVPSIVVPPLGQIRVVPPQEVAADPVVLECRGKAGGIYGPCFAQGEYVFEGLPPGEYEVGPVEMFESLSLRVAQGMTAFPHDLDPGKSLLVPWDSAWAISKSLEGRVQCMGIAPSDVVVVPRFASPDLPVQVGVIGRYFRVSSDSTYALENLVSQPSELLFGRMDEIGRFVPLAVGRPGETTTVAAGLLVVESLAEERAVVRLAPMVPGRKTIGWLEYELRQGANNLGHFPADVRVISGIKGTQVIHTDYSRKTVVQASR